MPSGVISATRAAAVAAKLRAAGFKAYFAGGCVRDALLGLEPKDYDVATDARPEQVVALFPRSQAVGAHFGVVVVRTGPDHVEVATFRTDGSYKDGRRPEEVTYSTPEEDAQRRDFTVNGIFQDPATDEVIDFVGGQADLAAKVLRAIGNPAERFREDHLRLMRAVRFAATLGWEIEPATWAAVKAEAPALAKISIERTRDEFIKIMLHPNRVRGLDLLDKSGLLTCIIPEMEAARSCSHPDFLGNHVRTDDHFAPVCTFNLENATLHFKIDLCTRIGGRLNCRFNQRQFLLATVGKLFFIHNVGFHG